MVQNKCVKCGKLFTINCTCGVDYTGYGITNINEVTENAKPFFGFEGRKIGINKTNTYIKEVNKVNKIYKYHIPIADEFELELPVGAKILTYQVQNDKGYIWAIVDITEGIIVKKVKFRMFGTGHSITEEIDELEYIGTIQIFDNSLVWHLFKVK